MKNEDTFTIMTQHYEERVLQIKRVTKVVKGGKKLSFRVILIIGDKRQKVALGVGKAKDISSAIEKASYNARKKILTVILTKKKTIPTVSFATYGASRICLRPMPTGVGIIAGGALRTILELAGIKDASAKQFGSVNILNNAKAALLALSNFASSETHS